MIHMAYVDQQRTDGHAKRVEYAMGRKAAFDRKVLASRAGVVDFADGQLVQVYRSDLTHTMSNDRKITVRWSEPHRVKTRRLNSYRLETVGGVALDGTFSSRRLRVYAAREGTRREGGDASCASTGGVHGTDTGGGGGDRGGRGGGSREVAGGGDCGSREMASRRSRERVGRIRAVGTLEAGRRGRRHKSGGRMW